MIPKISIRQNSNFTRPQSPLPTSQQSRSLIARNPISPRSILIKPVECQFQKNITTIQTPRGNHLGITPPKPSPMLSFKQPNKKGLFQIQLEKAECLQIHANDNYEGHSNKENKLSLLNIVRANHQHDDSFTTLQRFTKNKTSSNMMFTQLLKQQQKAQAPKPKKQLQCPTFSSFSSITSPKSQTDRSKDSFSSYNILVSKPETQCSLGSIKEQSLLISLSKDQVNISGNESRASELDMSPYFN